jgi:hypothetical protein
VSAICSPFAGQLNTSNFSSILMSFTDWIALGDVDIQGDSGGICTTLGDDSMSDSKQKSSYERVRF